MVALKDGFKVTDDQPPSEANCPGLAFLNAFVEHYTDANNYSGAQAKFDAATEIIANISQLLVIVKPPILGRLLSLLEMFCRTGAAPPDTHGKGDSTAALIQRGQRVRLLLRPGA